MNKQTLDLIISVALLVMILTITGGQIYMMWSTRKRDRLMVESHHQRLKQIEQRQSDPEVARQICMAIEKEVAHHLQLKHDLLDRVLTNLQFLHGNNKCMGCPICQSTIPELMRHNEIMNSIEITEGGLRIRHGEEG